MARKTASRSAQGRRASRKSISHPHATRSVAATALDAAPTAFSLSNAEVERALRTDERPGLLEDLFGAPAYAELRALARDAEAASVRGGHRVLIGMASPKTSEQLKNW
jgi:hypothetical protein